MYLLGGILHDVSHHFTSIGALWLALYLELEDDIPTITIWDILKEKEVACFLIRPWCHVCLFRLNRVSVNHVPLPAHWSLELSARGEATNLALVWRKPATTEYESSDEDGRQSSKRKKKTKNSRKQRKPKAEELENISQQLRESKFSGLQLRLWARMIEHMMTWMSHLRCTW